MEGFRWSLEDLRKHLIIFGYLWKTLGEVRPPSKYFGWPPAVFKCLCTNFTNHRCNLHLNFKFALELHFLHWWTYTWTALLIANQNQIIFSSVLLSKLFVGWEYEFDKTIFTFQGLGTEWTNGLECITSMGNGYLLPEPSWPGKIYLITILLIVSTFLKFC